MADVETSDSEPENAVPATPVARKKKVTSNKTKPTKPKKSIPQDEGMHNFQVKQSLVI